MLPILPDPYNPTPGGGGPPIRHPSKGAGDKLGFRPQGDQAGSGPWGRAPSPLERGGRRAGTPGAHGSGRGKRGGLTAKTNLGGPGVASKANKPAPAPLGRELGWGGKRPGPLSLGGGAVGGGGPVLWAGSFGGACCGHKGLPRFGANQTQGGTQGGGPGWSERGGGGPQKAVAPGALFRKEKKSGGVFRGPRGRPERKQLFGLVRKWPGPAWGTCGGGGGGGGGPLIRLLAGGRKKGEGI